MSKTSLLIILGRVGLAAITPGHAADQSQTNWATASFERILTEGKNLPLSVDRHTPAICPSNRTATTTR